MGKRSQEVMRRCYVRLIKALKEGHTLRTAAALAGMSYGQAKRWKADPFYGPVMELAYSRFTAKLVEVAVSRAQNALDSGSARLLERQLMARDPDTFAPRVRLGMVDADLGRLPEEMVERLMEQAKQPLLAERVTIEGAYEQAG